MHLAILDWNFFQVRLLSSAGDRNPVYFAAYGTLRDAAVDELANGDPAARAARRAIRQSSYIGRCFIPGKLHAADDGSYPAVTDPHGQSEAGNYTVGDLYELARADASAHEKLCALDAYEEFDPDAPEKSPFVRRVAPVRVLPDRLHAESGSRVADVSERPGDRHVSVRAWVYCAGPDLALHPVEGNDWFLATAKTP